MKYFKRIIGGNHQEINEQLWRKIFEEFDFEGYSNPVTHIREKYPHGDNILLISDN